MENNNSKKSTNAILSMSFALIGIYLAISSLSGFLHHKYGGSYGNMWWEMSLIFTIIFFALPTAIFAIVMGKKGLKNLCRKMAIWGLTVGIISVIIDIVVFVLICTI